MKNKIVFVSIISEDPVFYIAMEAMFKHYAEGVMVKIYTSLAELRDSKITTNSDLILVDEIVAGAAIFEVISYLRNTRKEICSIFYFGKDVHDIKTRAFRRGANYFYSKPFDPRMVVYEIVNNWVSISKKDFKSIL